MIWGMRPHGPAEFLEKRRREAVRRIKTGESFRAVASVMRASLSSVVRWCQAHRKKGTLGLNSRPTPGRPSRLSAPQKRRLEKVLARGPLKAGYSTDLWTLKRVGEIVRNEFDVSYTLPNLWHVMAGLGWSCQKPEKRARDRDEAAIRHWKRYRWPHIKKR